MIDKRYRLRILPRREFHFSYSDEAPPVFDEEVTGHFGTMAEWGDRSAFELDPAFIVTDRGLTAQHGDGVYWWFESGVDGVDRIGLLGIDTKAAEWRDPQLRYGYRLVVDEC